MNDIRGPYISRVKISNYRNFKAVDVQLSHKQIIIGENNVGKTNFLKAIQLILDPKLSDSDRELEEADFHDDLDSPMESGEEIEISIEIKGFEHNQILLSILADASVSDQPPTIRLTYKYYPVQREDGTYTYQYTIFQGTNPDFEFTHVQRKYLNIKVINAIRDVESEMKNSRRSPLTNLLKQYQFDKKELEDIAKKMKEHSGEVLTIGEIMDLQRNITSRFSKILGEQPYTNISLETVDIDPNRILNTLKLMIGDGKQRPTSETSLGINNILYIALILLSLEDKTVPTFLKREMYSKLLEHDVNHILSCCYETDGQGNYFLKKENQEEKLVELYEFMGRYNPVSEGFTILAIEEPEAHLHPTLQRIIYKDVMKSKTSVLMTTHSPYITSVAPLQSIVHLRDYAEGTVINTTANLELTPGEKKDLERFIDVKRGELYFGKGVILVEGIAEEYLIPAFADLLGRPLDLKGIITCNVNSTNFTPYVKFLEYLGIPYVVITDGDFYKVVNGEKKYHVLYGESTDDEIGYLGNELMTKLLIEVEKISEKTIPADHNDQVELFASHGFHLGYYTMEVDIMKKVNPSVEARSILSNVFNELTTGGDRQKQNFQNELKAGDYWACLRKIESSQNGIGKGRFAQRLSTACTKLFIPDYIETAITSIYQRVDKE
ncbi:hypothetical protein J6TS1_48090 [Siminovitchia terrae]|uniref:ATP-dependent endonuclease n=1 Tax=Siminovitchia terrae TaxID=1914933 RepID=A0ABQ4L4R8_SIMTE|nr:AAA family ATPase [Siminovitchia terrae]GIN98939.1 hypothetical protein J6TS1_48090 [Siminovitchia terrae]